MDIEDQQALLKYIQPGETLQWSGTPLGGMRLKRSDRFMIPFSLLWGGFACFWEYTAWKSDAPFPMLIFGMAFVVAGLYLIFGRFVYDMLAREDTVYGLTSERALILSGMFSKSLKSIDLKGVPEISYEERSDGRGTITFGRTGIVTGWGGFGDHSSRSGQPAAPAFEMIENGATVMQMVRSAQRR